MLLEDWIGKAQRVPVAIVDGDADEAPTDIAFGEAAMRNSRGPAAVRSPIG